MKNKAPKVSVVLPVYNGERYLRESIESVIGQTFTDWELIIVDDCSTDNTLKIAQQFAESDSRIIVLHNKTNKKLPATLNVGFRNAHGEYLTWTSDDNIAKPNWLSVLVNALDKNPGDMMVVADMDYIDQDGNFITTASQRYPGRKSIQLAYICNVGAAFMYRRAIAEKIGGYDEDTFCAEDYDYWCRIALNGSIKYIPDNIYKYRRQSGSLTATKKDQQIAKTAAINKKYYDRFISVYKLNWLQRHKLAFLLQPHVKKTYCYLFFKIYHIILFQLCNLLFFWNSNLRHKSKSLLKIKL